MNAPGELDRVLDRLGAAEREEDLVHVARQDLGQLRPEPGPDLGRERRLDVLELGRLRGDRVDDAPVAVADVDRHQLAVEVEDPLALGRVQVDALGVVDRDRVDGALGRPREERVLARERGRSPRWSSAPGAVRDAHGSPRSRPRRGRPLNVVDGRPLLTPARTARFGACGDVDRQPRAAPQLPEVVGDEQQSEQRAARASTISRMKVTTRMIAQMIARNIAILQQQDADRAVEERLDREVAAEQHDDRHDRRQDPEPDDDGEERRSAARRSALPTPRRAPGAGRAMAARAPRRGGDGRAGRRGTPARRIAASRSCPAAIDRVSSTSCARSVASRASSSRSVTRLVPSRSGPGRRRRAARRPPRRGPAARRRAPRASRRTPSRVALQLLDALGSRTADGLRRRRDLDEPGEAERVVPRLADGPGPGVLRPGRRPLAGEPVAGVEAPQAAVAVDPGILVAR